MPGDLSDYRKEIDRIDDEILRLLNERSKSVVEIGKLKKQHDAGANLHTPAREAAIIERLVAQNSGPFRPTPSGPSIERSCRPLFPSRDHRKWLI